MVKLNYNNFVFKCLLRRRTCNPSQDSVEVNWVATHRKVRKRNVQLVTVSALKNALRWILSRGGKSNCRSLIFRPDKQNFYFYLNLDLIKMLKKFQNLESLYFENTLFTYEIFNELLGFSKLIKLQFMEQTIPVCINMDRRSRMKRFSYRCLRTRTHSESKEDIRAFWSMRNAIMRKRSGTGLEATADYVIHDRMFSLTAIKTEFGEFFKDACQSTDNNDK